MNFKKYSPFIFLIVIITVSCKKGKHPTPVKDDAIDLYVGGWSATAHTSMTATYWKNAVAFPVADSSLRSVGHSIAVQAGNVYLAGERIPDQFNPLSVEGLYWKNGVANKLPGSASEAFSIAVQGSDVYVGGIATSSQHGAVVYWKNGAINSFTSGSSYGYESAMAVNSTDVYIAGYSRQPNKKPVATYWKKGVMDTLTKSSDSIYTTAEAIAINGLDVYVAGVTGGDTIRYLKNTVATYWKNGVATALVTEVKNAFVTGITINGSDVYVSGTGFDPTANYHFVGVYWRNGVPTRLLDGSLATEAEAIAVNGNDVYVVGGAIKPNGVEVPVLWKNGVPTELSNSGVAFCIAIVRR